MGMTQFDPLPGQLYQHTETGHRAVFRFMRHGLMVLNSAKWGECRWHPRRARLVPLSQRMTKTHCKNGHELTDANRAPRTGGVNCRKCKNEQQNARRNPAAHMAEAAR